MSSSSESNEGPPAAAAHGATRLPSVIVDSYNVELKDEGGFLGDRANKNIFRDIMDGWRAALKKYGDDPFGDEASSDFSKKELDDLLAQGNAEAAGVIQGSIEDFSQEFAVVIKRFLKLKEWKGTPRIAVGGGFRASRVGELVIGRTSVLLKGDKMNVELAPIHNDPDQAGLIGAAHLAPKWMFQAFDAIVGVDIGGTNIRAGIVKLNLKAARDLSKAKVWKASLWRHGSEEDVRREDVVGSLVEMLNELIAAARKREIALAPFIGIGCPGVILEDGSIERGAQNLPGNWESNKFNLPAFLHEKIPKIGQEETSIVMHNDAVVQGLSEVPHMADLKSWGILTIGTGLGNARFTNRNVESK
jgi:predicted NBD/HSP70 family sugar kinase